MTELTWQQRVAASRYARAAAFPMRLQAVSKHGARTASLSINWLVRRKEHTNYTYDLSALNLEHLAWWVSVVSSSGVNECRGYIDECLSDVDLQSQVLRETRRSDRQGLADLEVHVGRRAGWYALVRATRPNHVVETGTDKGLGTLVIASALLRNGRGHLTSIDINRESGFLVSGKYASVTTLVVADSVASLSNIDEPIDLFIHDSDHSAAHEAAEFGAVASALSHDAVVLSDNSHVTTELPSWAESTGRAFLFFREVPEEHWYPGGGIGAAWYLRS